MYSGSTKKLVSHILTRSSLVWTGTHTGLMAALKAEVLQISVYIKLSLVLKRLYRHIWAFTDSIPITGNCKPSKIPNYWIYSLSNNTSLEYFWHHWVFWWTCNICAISQSLLKTTDQQCPPTSTQTISLPQAADQSNGDQEAKRKRKTKLWALWFHSSIQKRNFDPICLAQSIG